MRPGTYVKWLAVFVASATIAYVVSIAVARQLIVNLDLLGADELASSERSK